MSAIRPKSCPLLARNGTRVPGPAPLTPRGPVWNPVAIVASRDGRGTTWRLFALRRAQRPSCRNVIWHVGAYACDERFPWTCKPVPSTASSEPAETSKIVQAPANQPPPPRRDRKDGQSRARSAQVSRKRLARKAALVTRTRHAKAVAAERATAAQTGRDTPGRTVGSGGYGPRGCGGYGAQGCGAALVALHPCRRRQQRSETPSSRRCGRIAPWSQPRRAGRPRASRLGAAASAPVQAPLRVASQQDVNEMDLAAVDAAAASESFWLRGLFLALGGLLALGSALRLLV